MLATKSGLRKRTVDHGIDFRFHQKNHANDCIHCFRDSLCSEHWRSHVSFYRSRSWLDFRCLFCISQFCGCAAGSSGLGRFVKVRDADMFLHCNPHWHWSRLLSLLTHPGRRLKLSWPSMGCHAHFTCRLVFAVCRLADGCHLSLLQKELALQHSVYHDVQSHLCLSRMQNFPTCPSGLWEAP